MSERLRDCHLRYHLTCRMRRDPSKTTGEEPSRARPFDLSDTSGPNFAPRKLCSLRWRLSCGLTLPPIPRQKCSSTKGDQTQPQQALLTHAGIFPSPFPWLRFR